MNRRIATILALSGAIIVAVMARQPAWANGQTTCPKASPWVKVDNLSGSTYLYTAPAGYLITDVCYKHSTFVHQFSIDPATSFSVVADFHTDQHPGHNHQYALSHAAFRLAAVPTATAEPTQIPTEEPTDEPTPTATDEPSPTPTDIHNDCEDEGNCEDPTPTPTDVGPDPTPTGPVPTEGPGPTDTPVVSDLPAPCEKVECGYLFHLIGPDGQSADFASFSQRADGTWYLPSVTAQLNCLGWIAVSAPYGRPIGPKEAAALISCQGGDCR